MAQIRAKVTEDAETLKGWKFRLIRLMYERGYEQARILELFRLIDWMIRLPKALEADFRQTLYAYEEQQRMPYVTTVEQAGIQQGEALILLAQLQEKFGHDSAEVYRERITAAEPEQLLQWSKRILSAETPETIFH
ncbi:transposase [Halochromatium roseum]|uniref:transposase n=1 Tax=Halochromatium roseum TaxID=391920 RepID=UPI001913E5C8|nr:transposase [Halochromatium roseum]